MKIRIILLYILMIFVLISCQNKEIAEYTEQGIYYLKKEDYIEALNNFNIALQSGNGEVSDIQYQLLLYKAECLFMLKRYDECRKIYNTLVTIDKNNKQYNELNQIMTNLDDLSTLKNSLNSDDLIKAEEMISLLKNTNLEHDKTFVFNQAVLYEKKGEWKDALNMFEYYLTQNPGDEKATHEIEFIKNILE